LQVDPEWWKETTREIFLSHGTGTITPSWSQGGHGGFSWRVPLTESQGFLITASLLTCWHLSTIAQVIIEPVPPHVVEGENILLHVRNLPENLSAIFWHKGVRNMSLGIGLYSLLRNSSVPGSVHSGRETVYRNGSLQIYNVTQKDTGFYTLRAINRRVGVASITTTYLHVYGMSKESLKNCWRMMLDYKCPWRPTIESVPPTAAEGANVLLDVQNLPKDLRVLLWYKGVTMSNNFEVVRHIIAKNISVPGPAHSGRETVYSNGSLLIHNVTWKDIGFYTLRTLSTDMKIGLVHVQLLVNTSLSTCCNPLIIEPVPQNATEGESVLLLAQNLPEDVMTFSWYKGVYSIQIFKMAEYNRDTNSITPGRAYSRRAIVYINGSMLLRDITEDDAGLYTLQTLSRDLKIETTHVQLHVNRLSEENMCLREPVAEPFMKVTGTTVTEQSSVVFTCISIGTGTSIHWIFNNQTLQLTERMTLSPKKCRLSIDPVRREDAGQYKCEVSNPVSSKTSLPVRLAVINE
ncbi:carcinoembryonic antigen-related cell adhesion molecule 3-like isoform X2, partial [Sigmodon hispidus]